MADRQEPESPPPTAPPVRLRTEPRQPNKSTCGKCASCMVDECGACIACLDMPRFGGRHKRRQKCHNRPECLVRGKGRGSRGGAGGGESWSGAAAASSAGASGRSAKFSKHGTRSADRANPSKAGTTARSGGDDDVPDSGTGAAGVAAAQRALLTMRAASKSTGSRGSSRQVGGDTPSPPPAVPVAAVRAEARVEGTDASTFSARSAAARAAVLSETGKPPTSSTAGGGGGKHKVSSSSSGGAGVVQPPRNVYPPTALAVVGGYGYNPPPGTMPPPHHHHPHPIGCGGGGVGGFSGPASRYRPSPAAPTPPAYHQHNHHGLSANSSPHLMAGRAVTLPNHRSVFNPHYAPPVPPNSYSTYPPLRTPHPSQIVQSIPSNASAVFHVLDRRVNFDNYEESDASFYALLRGWVWDDPYRVLPPRARVGGTGGNLTGTLGEAGTGGFEVEGEAGGANAGAAGSKRKQPSSRGAAEAVDVLAAFSSSASTTTESLRFNLVSRAKKIRSDRVRKDRERMEMNKVRLEGRFGIALG